MRTFAEKLKAIQKNTSARSTISRLGHFGRRQEVNQNLYLQHTIGSQAEQRQVGGSRGASSAAETGRLDHDFSRISIHSAESAGMQPNSVATTPRHIRTQQKNQMPAKVACTPALYLRRTCACGGGCPKYKGEHNSRERRYKANQAIGRRDNKIAGRARGPRSDGLDDAPYRGPDDSTTVEQRGPGTGTGMGCVFGPMRVVASGALEGGYTVNDYLMGGLSWGAVSSPGSAGRDGRGFKVQLSAAFSNDTSLGVSQTMTHGGSNQSFLDGTAAYLGRAAGSVTNGATFNEPVLDAGNPYAHTGWELQYGPKSGTDPASLLSFADVPRAGAGDKGHIDFRTCFFSRGGPCQQNNTCRTWRWAVDFTGSNNVNTVT